ncbi:MAG: transcription antitermination factor NusB, partial [Gammaproteobacteria bacterium]
VDMAYFSQLTRLIPENFDELLANITPALDRSWTRIDTVEQAVLLVGAYELQFCSDVPWRVVVNEAVDLCKMFGAQDAHKYINGVLDKIARGVRTVEISGPSTLEH